MPDQAMADTTARDRPLRRRKVAGSVPNSRVRLLPQPDSRDESGTHCTRVTYADPSVADLPGAIKDESAPQGVARLGTGELASRAVVSAQRQRVSAFQKRNLSAHEALTCAPRVASLGVCPERGVLPSVAIGDLRPITMGHPDRFSRSISGGVGNDRCSRP